ncbi:hypothetical protein FQN54_000867 [Arachnomyces sp. PD_36]|nr:hypothetical protein FQN54_000867 [Arachnomyces sp. PD_36]
MAPVDPMQTNVDRTAREMSDFVFDGFKNKVVKLETLLRVTHFMAWYRPSARPTDRARINSDSAPCDMGPFILTEYVEHATDLAQELRYLNGEDGDVAFLYKGMAGDKLEYFYGQVANIYLKFPNALLTKLELFQSVKTPILGL